MKKVLAFLIVLMLLSASVIVATPPTIPATLNINTAVPGALRVRFTNGDQERTVSPDIVETNENDEDFGSFLTTVNLGVALEVFSAFAWKIQADAANLENTTNDSFITFDITNHDDPNFAEGAKTVGTTGGPWTGNYGITISNFSYFEELGATAVTDYPGEGSYEGSIVFTISVL